MAKKTISPKATSSEREILAMYEEVLPLLWDNPEKLDMESQINRHIRALVPYDFFYSYFERSRTPTKGLSVFTMETAETGQELLEQISVSVVNEESDTFDALVEKCYQRALSIYGPRYPQGTRFDRYQMNATGLPGFAIGFVRHRTSASIPAFEERELHTFAQLAPHVTRLFRTVKVAAQPSSRFEYFHSFAQISSRLLREYTLSDAEFNLVPDILFGRTNEEIAERHFISHATVKTHINHILKKTGTKHRVAFISKFFTSPEQVRL